MKADQNTWTVVYVNDDGHPSCYGQFSTHEAAERFASKIEKELDADRDEAGGGAGNAYAAMIRRKADWE